MEPQRKDTEDQHYDKRDITIEVLKSERLLEREIHNIEKTLIDRIHLVETTLTAKINKLTGIIIALFTLLVIYLEWRFK